MLIITLFSVWIAFVCGFASRLSAADNRMLMDENVKLWDTIASLTEERDEFRRKLFETELRVTPEQWATSWERN